MWVRRRRSTGSVKHRKNCCKIWTRQRCSNSLRILRNFNAPNAIPLRKSGLFVAVADESWSTSRSPTNISKGQLRFQFDPWRYNIITKNSSRGPKHGQSERQIVFFMPKNMLRKAKNKKNGHHPTNLSRWKADGEYRQSLGFIGIWEKEFHALRPNCFGETRLFSYESWTNTKFKALGYLDKCWRTSTTSTTTPRYYAAAKRECQRPQDEFLAEQSSSTNQFIRANKCVKIRISKSKDVKIMITLLIGKQDGNGTKSSRKTCRVLRLRRPHHGRILHGKIGRHGGGVLQSLTEGSEWLFFGRGEKRFLIAGT